MASEREILAGAEYYEESELAALKKSHAEMKDLDDGLNHQKSELSQIDYLVRYCSEEIDRIHRIMASHEEDMDLGRAEYAKQRVAGRIKSIEKALDNVNLALKRLKRFLKALLDEQLKNKKGGLMLLKFIHDIEVMQRGGRSSFNSFKKSYGP